MKITGNREKLLAAFQTASSVAPARSPKPILQNVKLEATSGRVVLLATDLEIGIRVEVPGLEVETEGTALLPIGRFGSILRETTSETVLLESDGQNTHVHADRSEFHLPAADPHEFPPIDDFNEERYHQVPARLLREMIRRTIFSTDNESGRFALGGILLEMSDEEIIAVATDGRRLSTMTGPAQAIGGHSSGEGNTIVPAKAMQLIERALTDADAEINIAATQQGFVVHGPRVTILSRLVEGRFPKWREVFPERGQVQRVDVVVGPLLSAVRQAQIVVSDESVGVDFKFADGQLELTGQGSETGQSRVQLPVPYDGPELKIILNPKYVTDYLRVLDPERTVTIELQDAESAAVCSTDDGYRYVLMPLSRDR